VATRNPGRPRRKRAPKPSRTKEPPTGDALGLQLNAIATELHEAYATCVTVEAALRWQGADQGVDIASCLRRQVADCVARQIDKLNSLAEQHFGVIAARAAEKVSPAKP
jgi:hypothetical protein